MGPTATGDPGVVSHDVARAAVRLAVGQGGVVRRDQLRDLGLSPRTLSRRINAGQWETHGRRVLVLPGTAPGLLRDSLVVGHQLYPRGALTGFSALAARGILLREVGTLAVDPLPWVRHPEHTTLRARVIRRPVGGDVDRVLGLPVVRMEAAMVDLLRVLPKDDAHDLVLRLAQRWGSARISGLLAAEVGTRASARVTWLRTLLATGAHSQAEEELVRLLIEAGISGFAVNYPLAVAGREYRIDVAFPEQRVAVEVDGRAFHTDHRSFQRDRTRQNDLVAAGWRVLRFTWEDLTRRPEQVLADISRFISR